jgi:hypothetical protein
MRAECANETKKRVMDHENKNKVKEVGHEKPTKQRQGNTPEIQNDWKKLHTKKKQRRKC